MNNHIFAAQTNQGTMRVFELAGAAGFSGSWLPIAHPTNPASSNSGQDAFFPTVHTSPLGSKAGKQMAAKTRVLTT